MEAAMHRLAGVTIGLISLAAPPATRARAEAVTLRVEAMSSRPVTFTVWIGAQRRFDGPRPDSLTATTPATIPLDSTVRELRILTRANAPVRVRVLQDSTELQRPANAWGRDVRLVRVDDHFQVTFGASLIQPR
jgi:hypothetical protein